MKNKNKKWNKQKQKTKQNKNKQKSFASLAFLFDFQRKFVCVLLIIIFNKIENKKMVAKTCSQNYWNFTDNDFV